MLRKFITTCFVSLLLAAMGCAHLDIRVDEYLGDANNSGDVQLGEAFGQARNCRDVAVEYLARLGEMRPRSAPSSVSGSGATSEPVFDPEWSDMAPWVQQVKNYYDLDQLDNLKIALDAAPKNSANYVVIRTKLALALVRYSQTCIAVGQRIGLTGINRPFWPLFENGRQPVEASLVWEQDGLHVQRLAANVLDGEQYSGLASMLGSLNQGVIADQLLTLDDSYNKSLERDNWTYINTIQCDATGNSQYVLVKDEVGNWTIKSIENDPSDLIKAAIDSASTMVDVLGAAYGIPLPKPADSDTTSSTTAAAPAAGGASSTTSTLVTTGNATHMSAQLGRAQWALKYSLERILDAQQSPDPAAIKTAVQIYRGELTALGAPAPATTPPATATPAPAPAAPAAAATASQ